MMKLFVGNLNFEATTDQVEQLFEHYGPVNEVKIPLDRETQKPRGFGFVEMKNRDDAEKAMHGLNDHEFLGRKLNVNVATERKDKKRS